MLGKLLKYDLKYGVKIFVLIHAILFIASILGRIFFMNRIDFEHADGIMVSSLVIFSAVMMFLYMVVCFSTWLLIAIRFYRNLFKGRVLKLDTACFRHPAALGQDPVRVYLVHP